MDKKYYVGLDMGTASNGYAVTDTEYNLLRVRGKDFWGVNEFETAETALSRRNARSSRRRVDRNKARLALVKYYFSNEVAKEDPSFFLRLDNSSLFLIDKDSRIDTQYILFSDCDYTDKDFYKEYPTIFHLRTALLHDEVQVDKRYVRKLYIAISSMFHHRGHFYSNIEIGDDRDVRNLYEKLIELLLDEEEIDFSRLSFDDYISVAENRELSRTAKKEHFFNLVSVDKKDKKATEFIKLISGLEVSAKTLFELEIEEDIKINFSSFTYQDEISNIEEGIGNDNYYLIELAKTIYDYSAVSSILGGYKYLSEARVALYDKHASDLKLLKRVYKNELGIDKYNDMFRSDKAGTYSAYVNSVNSCSGDAKEDKVRRSMKNRKSSDLYDTIKKDFKGHESDDIAYILDEIAKEVFLPKQITGANGIIPNQIHEKELKAILKNAVKNLPFLSEVDESGLACYDRIQRLFSFCIPYNVGPVGEGSKTGWAVRKKPGRVLPWNIEEKIDIEKTTERFITNMIRRCSYLSDYEVLPKQSLLYEKYCVLNEINTIKLNDERLDTNIKQRLFKELYLRKNKVSRSDIEKFFINNGYIEEKTQLTGIDVKINNTLSSYHKFLPIFQERMSEDNIVSLCEEIIRYGTIYSDSRSMYKERLSKLVDEGKLTKDEAKKMSGFRFKDWGKLSKELLLFRGADIETGECVSIMDVLWSYSLNFMEIINSKLFDFISKIKEEENKQLKVLSTFEYEDLDDYYFSPAVKRMIWQTLKLLKEITTIMGNAPDRLFIEMTREDGEKGRRTESRENQLLKLYKDEFNKSEYKLWEEEIKKLALDGSINSKKVYLYLLQNGKDAYTGERIELADVLSGEKYDIEHIYPRHFVTDNNLFNNLVLTNKYDNEHVKGDKYPIPDEISSRKKARELWEILHRTGFMNDEKYHRLTSKTPFSDEQKAGFIARQLVETSQGTKGVADLIKQLMPETDIVYSKASNVSKFRQENGFIKNRLVNDFHHAQDAYLNIVVGNVYYTKFTQNPMNFINELNQDAKKNHYNLSKMFDWDVERNGVVAWNADKENGTIQTVKKVMKKNTPIISRKSFIQSGEFYDVQPRSHYDSKADNYVPRKQKLINDVERYGGFTSLSPAFFIFIEAKKGKKRIKTFESVAIYYASKMKNDQDIINYCEQQLGYSDVRLIANKINKHSLIKLNGYYLYICGFDNRKNVELKNAISLSLTQDLLDYTRMLEKAKKEIDASKEKKYIGDIITSQQNEDFYKILCEKHCNTIYSKHPKSIGQLLKDGIEMFIELSLEDQIRILLDIISYTDTSIASKTFSLELIGGPKEIGRIRISGNMTNTDELLLVHRSVTGMYEKTINLLM